MADTLDKMALLVMDVQPGVVERLDHKEKYLDKVKLMVAAARRGQIPIIYVVVGFRPGFPEVSPDNKSFSTIKAAASGSFTSPQPAITPAKDDLVVVKKRVSAFSGSDLEVLLRAKHIRHLLLAGIATSGVVLSTVREAADKDFRLTVLSDLCADFDDEVHTLLVEKIFPRQATVVTSEQWIKESKPNQLKAQA